MTVTLSGDTLMNIAQLEFTGGIKTAECAYSVDATATGPSGSTVTLNKGQVVYTFYPSNDTMMVLPIKPEAAAAFWEGDKNTVATGAALKSKRQGLSLSMPPRAIKGTLTFEYTTSDASAPQMTAPFNFHCRP